MRRRSFLGLGATGLAFAQGRAPKRAVVDCGCGFAPQQIGNVQYTESRRNVDQLVLFEGTRCVETMLADCDSDTNGER